MQVIQRDYMTQLLKLSIPGDVRHWGRLTAKVVIEQPSGYVLETAECVVHGGKQAEIAVRYPLLDDGAWEQIEGFCKAFEYEMGTYTFTAHLFSDGHPIVTETTEFDQDQLYANSWKTRIRNDFPPGFIECAPLRSVCIDHDEVPATIRLKTDRVPACRVRIDVTTRRGTEPLLEPIELDLTAEPQIVTFGHAGWERGEYWIRVQVLEAGQPVGPYMVRKFWKEVIGPEPRPELPLQLGTSLQYMVDGWLFERSAGLDFWPMSYDPNPDRPAITMDKPWEYGIMEVRSLTYDDAEGVYKLEYTFGVESYRRQGYAWHSLVDEITVDPAGLPPTWEQFERDTQRAIAVQQPRGEDAADPALAQPILPGDSRPVAYRKLLWSLLRQGGPVQEFNIPPLGYSYAILPNLQPPGERKTDYVLLAVPGIRPDGQLPRPGEFDASQAQVFEMYPEDLDRPAYTCLATSRDGVSWEKPELGLVEFHGSKANNILRTEDEANRAYAQRAHEADTHAIMPAAKKRQCSFRLFDPDRDGPVDMDRVFMAQIATGYGEKVDFVWPDDFADCGAALGFTPELRAYYPMMYRGGDEFLFLSDQAFMYLGAGMDLMHSSESIRHQIECSDDRTLCWYYRPNSPAYPPHNCPWDNHQGPLRNLAVLWTDDGRHFHKRFCIGPDEFDPPGMQFYNMALIGELPRSHQGRTMLRRTSSPGVAVQSGELYVAELRSYAGAEQTQVPELIWSRDLLHWHRFTHHRAPMVKLGTEDGSYNWGMYFQAQSYYPFKDKDGNDAWWLVNSANSARHNHVTIAIRHPTVEDVQVHYPHYSEAPFFVDWPTLFRRGVQFRRTPLFTHIKPGRLAYTAPTETVGEFTTHPIHFTGIELVLNAQVEAGGSLRVEVQDEAGQVLDGYSLAESAVFTGDEVSYTPSWGTRRLAALAGRALKLRVVLGRAKLFTLHIK